MLGCSTEEFLSTELAFFHSNHSQGSAASAECLGFKLNLGDVRNGHNKENLAVTVFPERDLRKEPMDILRTHRMGSR